MFQSKLNDLGDQSELGAQPRVEAQSEQMIGLHAERQQGVDRQQREFNNGSMRGNPTQAKRKGRTGLSY